MLCVNKKKQILMAAFDYPVEEGIEIGSLVFDGLIIYNANVRPKDYDRCWKGVRVE